ncbi:MAG TPA: fluoride efflux transporter CrcB [Thermoanaerobaculia bacterium]|nr:fluoride efflux transporter CrcB [Thermoanaerobaculia bacterium]
MDSDSVSSMTRFFLICLGGAVGTGARYLLSLATARLWGTTLPLATLVVNLLGSFLMGFLMNPDVGPDLSPTTRLALTVGLLGGFTTYSAFNYEMTRFFRSDDWGQGFFYLLITVVGCLISGAAGIATARVVSGK